MRTVSLYFFGGCSVWLRFAIRASKQPVKKSNIEAENSLRDRSYCWRVLSDQVRVNNIVFAIEGNTGIVVLGWQTIDLLISAAYTYQYCLPSSVLQPTDTVVSVFQFCVQDFQSMGVFIFFLAIFHFFPDHQCKVNIHTFQH